MHHPVLELIIRNGNDSLRDVVASRALAQMRPKALGLMGSKAACTEGDCDASNLLPGQSQHRQVKCSALNICIHPARKMGVRAQFFDAGSACFMEVDHNALRPQIRCRWPAIGGWQKTDPSHGRDHFRATAPSTVVTN